MRWKTQNVSFNSFLMGSKLEFIAIKSFLSLVESLGPTNIGFNARWNQHGSTIAGGNGKGDGLNQLSTPMDLYIDDDNETIYIVDGGNHRIVAWKYGAISGQVVAGGNGSGNRTDQLNSPRGIVIYKKNDCVLISDQLNRRIMRWPRNKGTNGQTIIPNIDCARLAIDSDGYFYVSDYEKDEVRRWRAGDSRGTVVAGGNGKGDRLNRLNCPTTIFVDHEHSVYVLDSGNDRVIKWLKDAKEGIVVAGGRGKGNSPAQLSRCGGMVVDQYGTIYVSDCDNHRVMRWSKGAAQGSIVVGGNGRGAQSNQLCYPTALSFDRQGNLYVLDYGNQRVQKFNIDPISNR